MPSSYTVLLVRKCQFFVPHMHLAPMLHVTCDPIGSFIIHFVLYFAKLIEFVYVAMNIGEI